MVNANKVEVSMSNKVSEVNAELVKFGKAVDEFRNSRLFKKVIESAYFTEEAKRLCFASTDNELQDDVDQRLIAEQLKAIGHLNSYLTASIAIGNIAQSNIDTAEVEEIKNSEISLGIDEITGDEFEVAK